MTKVALLVATLFTLAAGMLAFMNGSELARTREAKAANHRAIRTELVTVNELVKKVDTLNSDISRVEGELQVEQEKLKGQRLKIAQSDSESKRVEENIESSKMQLAKLQEDIRGLPEDVRPESIQEDLNRIKQRIAELKANVELKDKEIEQERVKLAGVQATLNSIQRKIDDRRKAYERNSMMATVVAVNSDWGFVIINAGEKEGITESTKLLVTRGTQTVGKINTFSVEGQRTLASILTDTLAPGMTVAPGDRVLVENLYE